MGTASDKVFLQSAIRPGRTHLPKPLESAIFIRTWEKMCFPWNDANCERDPFSRVCPRALRTGWRASIIPLPARSGCVQKGWASRARGWEMSWLVCGPRAPSSAEPGKGPWRSSAVLEASGRGWLGERHCVCDSSCAMAAPGLAVAGSTETQSCSCLCHGLGMAL